MLLVLGVLAAYFSIRTVTGMNTERDRLTAAALAQAKTALIGFAVTYADSHPGQVNGYLPLPDLGSSRNNNFTLNEGVAAANFLGNSAHLSVLGRLAWRTLELGPLRDGSGACLWYAVSGGHQDAQKTTPMNWDSLGQFDIFGSDGTPSGTVNAGGNEHQRAVAVVFAPGVALADQMRSNSAVDSVTECSGNYDARNYLDSVNPNPLINNIVNSLTGLHGATGNYPLAAPKQIMAGPVLDANHKPLINDRLLAIAPDELFNLIKMRADFKTDIDAMVGDLSACLNGLLPTDPGFLASTGNKGVDNILAACPATDPARINVLVNWRNNLLYAKPAAASTVNGTSGCTAVLLFGGARTQRSVAPLVAQVRITAAQTGSAAVFGDAAMYLEAGNTIFPASGAYSGSGFFNAGAASADLVRCIKGLAAGSTQQSFARDFSGFIVAGVGVSPVAATQSLAIATAAGSAGGCFWSPTAVPLAGKTLRAYYDFKFSLADSFAVIGTGLDRGNGFTLQLVSAEPGIAPDICGAEAAMGTLAADSNWGSNSIIVETDVNRDAAAPNDQHDPSENHTAILLNGNIDHLQAGASMSAACDGTAAACRHMPANKFEEAPPAQHHQRIEIHSGCDAACSVCNQFPLAAPHDYSRVAVWVDCMDCSDVVADLDRLTQVPTLQRCVTSNTALSSVYWGFTGGFRSGSRQQGVTLGKLILRSE
jgi:hypothetical protein